MSSFLIKKRDKFGGIQMKNDEVLLTNYPYILKLINIGVSIKKIVY